VLGLVRLNGATRFHSFKRKDPTGHVEYWKAACGETRLSGLDGGKERKLLPIRTKSEQGAGPAHVFGVGQVG
jgi:hypothetical protein